MKISNSILIFHLALVCAYGGSSKDTSFSANLNNDGKLEIISASFEQDKAAADAFTGKYMLSVNGSKAEGSVEYAIDFAVSIVDLNRNDLLYEVLLAAVQEVGSDYFLWRYESNKLKPAGQFSSFYEPVFEGNGNVNVTSWMGFWILDYRFETTESGELVPVYKEINEVRYYPGSEPDIKVTAGFDILKEGNDGSSVSAHLKKGAKIQILKADINTTCEGANYKPDCYWYLIRTEKGEEGWARLKNFQEKTEGIPWAG